MFFCSQTVYDEWYITLYNLIYTALPVLGMSLFDQVCTKATSYLYLKYSRYTLGF